MRIRHLIIVTITISIFSLFSQTAYPQTPDETDKSALRINQIRFDGLRKTREKTVLRILEPIRPGAPFSAGIEEKIIQDLRESGLFNPEISVQTEIDGPNVTLTVMLKERWSLIPVPLFSFAKNGDWKVGFIAIENNLLGFNKILGLGSSIGSDGWSILSFYSDPYLFGSDLAFSAGINAGLDENEDLRPDEAVLRDYKADKVGLTVGLEFPVGDRLFLTGEWEYDRSILRKDSAAAEGMTNLHSTGIRGELKWKDLYYDIPFQRGLLIKGRAGWNWGLDDETEHYPVLDGKLKWSGAPWLNHLLSMTAGFGWGKLPAQKEFRLGGQPGSYTLPMQKITADQYIAVGGEYNLPVRSFNWGTLTVKGFYEAGLIESETLSRTVYHGPGFGMEIYINDLAIPAIGLNFGWNLETGLFQFSAGIGMSGPPD